MHWAIFNRLEILLSLLLCEITIASSKSSEEDKVVLQSSEETRPFLVFLNRSYERYGFVFDEALFQKNTVFLNTLAEELAQTVPLLNAEVGQYSSRELGAVLDNFSSHYFSQNDEDFARAIEKSFHQATSHIIKEPLKEILPLTYFSLKSNQEWGDEIWQDSSLLKPEGDLYEQATKFNEDLPIIYSKAQNTVDSLNTQIRVYLIVRMLPCQKTICKETLRLSDDNTQAEKSLSFSWEGFKAYEKYQQEILKSHGPLYEKFKNLILKFFTLKEELPEERTKLETSSKFPGDPPLTPKITLAQGYQEEKSDRKILREPINSLRTHLTSFQQSLFDEQKE